MKKLATIVAGLACGLAFAGEGGSGIISGNIVGYSTPEFEAGNAMFTPMFVTIGGKDEYPLQNIIPTGEGVPSGEDWETFIYVQKLTSKGRTDGQLWYWMDFTEDDLIFGEITRKGWYDAVGEVMSDISFKPGEAFWGKFPTDKCALQFNGEVKVDETYKTVNSGNTACGNPYAVDVALQDITPIGANVPTGEDWLTFIYVQKLNAQGHTDGQLWYWMDFTEDDLVFGEITRKGWYDAVGEVESDIKLKPGEGLWVNSPAACEFYFPGLELK